jgi:hypothetical protein
MIKQIIRATFEVILLISLAGAFYASVRAASASAVCQWNSERHQCIPSLCGGCTLIAPTTCVCVQ